MHARKLLCVQMKAGLEKGRDFTFRHDRQGGAALHKNAHNLVGPGALCILPGITYLQKSTDSSVGMRTNLWNAAGLSSVRLSLLGACRFKAKHQ